MHRILPKKKPNPVLDSMTALSNKFITTADARDLYATSTAKFATALVNMIDHLSPNLNEQFNTLATLYRRVSQINTSLAQSERRSGEDMRDLVERFAVVTRINREYQKHQELYKEKCNDLIEAMANNIVEHKKVSFDVVTRERIADKVVKARRDKKNEHEILKQTLAELIDAKERYNAFKVNRMRHAWVGWAADHAKLIAEEKAVLGEIVDFLSNTSFAPEVAEQARELIDAVPVADE